MKKYLRLILFTAFCLYFMGESLEPSEDIRYKIFQHGEFSFEYPDGKVNKQSDTDRLLLKVTKDSCTVQLEFFKESVDTTYDVY